MGHCLRNPIQYCSPSQIIFKWGEGLLYQFGGVVKSTYCYHESRPMPLKMGSPFSQTLSGCTKMGWGF